jgi:hypothetical protein
MARTAYGLLTAWIDTDERGVHQNARLLNDEGMLLPVVTLPLPPRFPRSQQLIPGAGNTVHLFWLDANDAGETRLYGALLQLPDLTVLRGPVEISDRLTLRYSVVTVGGGAIAAWSGGIVGEPVVTVQRIDADGRPIEVLHRLRAADYPSLLYNGTGLELSWLDVRDQSVCVGEVLLASMVACDARISGISLAVTDVLLGLVMGSDRSHQYLFWNVDRYVADDETWWSVRSEDTWSTPVRLSFSPLEGYAQVFTGYNSGLLQNVESGGETHFWLAGVLQEVSDSLPVVGMSEDGLTLLYFQAGEVVGYQSLGDALLLAPPLLLTDRDRHLYLGWADIRDGEEARLEVMTTRR